MNPDPSQPLKNARHELFAQELARGESATAAYRKAGYTARDADTAGPRLSGNVGVRARVAWFLGKAANATVLTVEEKRMFLARVVRAKLTETPDDSDLWNEVTITEDLVKRKLPDKLRAIAQDNDLAGEGSEAKAQDSLALSLRDGLLKRLSLVRP